MRVLGGKLGRCQTCYQLDDLLYGISPVVEHRLPLM